MSSVAITGNAAGAGVFTLASPNSASSFTATLPTATTTLVGTDATQTLTNKTIQGGSITSGTAVASTSGTSIDFTGIPSWVKRVIVSINNISTNGTSLVQIQIGNSAVITTGYVSYCCFAGGTTNTSTSTTGFLINAGAPAAGATMNGNLALILQNSTTNSWVVNYSGSTLASGSGFGNAGGGNKSLSGILDRVRITTVNGTDAFTAGSINILYEG
jgi:hypothetical protein